MGRLAVAADSSKRTRLVVPRPLAPEFFDDFNRANGGLGANWNATIQGGTSALQIVSNEVRSNTVGRQFATTQMSSVNHWVELDILNTPTSWFDSLCCRGTAAPTGSYYEAGWSSNVGGGAWVIYRTVSGTGTLLTSVTPGGGIPSPTVPGRFRVEVETISGNVQIRCYEIIGGVKSAARVSFTDSSGSKLTTGNYVGITLTAAAAARGDNFAASAL